jgi:hypothetical protein
MKDQKGFSLVIQSPGTVQETTLKHGDIWVFDLTSNKILWYRPSLGKDKFTRFLVKNKDAEIKHSIYLTSIFSVASFMEHMKMIAGVTGLHYLEFRRPGTVRVRFSKHKKSLKT